MTLSYHVVVMTESSQKTRRRGLSLAVKLAVTIGLLAVLAATSDWRRMLALAADLSPVLLLLAVGLHLSATSLASYRWYLLMRRLDFSWGWPFYLTSYVKATFFNQALPTSIGGDGIRILDCSRGERSAVEAFHGVFLDRIIGLAGLLLLNIGALTLDRRLLPTRVYAPLLLVLLALLLGLLSLLYLRKIRLFSVGRLRFLGTLSQRSFALASSPIFMAGQMLLSVLVHLLAMGMYYVLGRAIGFEYSLSVYFVLVPPVILLTILPISLAGWGIREGAMVGFFVLIGADRSQVLSYSLLCGLVSLAASLAGLVVYLLQKNRL